MTSLLCHLLLKSTYSGLLNEYGFTFKRYHTNYFIRLLVQLFNSDRGAIFGFVIGNGSRRSLIGADIVRVPLRLWNQFNPFDLLMMRKQIIYHSIHRLGYLRYRGLKEYNWGTGLTKCHDINFKDLNPTLLRRIFLFLATTLTSKGMTRFSYCNI